MGANKTANARDARLLGNEVINFTAAEVITGLGETIDCRGFTLLTAAWTTGSSSHSARISRVMSASATDHFSTDGGWDLMTAAGTTAGVVLSTALDWPFVHLTTTTSGSTGALYIGLL